MEAPNIKKSKGPEEIIQDAIIDFLRIREWFVKETHGNMFQHGFPDLFACHSSYGQRWIEVKNPLAYSFTPAQLKDFPKFSANGSGIWILTAATTDEYKKLWEPPNWYQYLIMLNQRGCSSHMTGPQVRSAHGKRNRI